MASQEQPRFKKGDWIRIVSGLNEGKTTTVTSVMEDPGGNHTYTGFFCGRLILARENEVEAY